MIRLPHIVFGAAVAGLGVAIAIAWGSGALLTYAGFVGLSACLGIALVGFNISGGWLARFGGRLTYRRWLG